MKRILFILPSLGLGGMERVLVTTANALSRRGYNITVMVLSPLDTLKNELDERICFFYKQPKPHIGQKIPYIRHKFYDDGMWETRATPQQLYEYYVGNEQFDVEIAFFRGTPVKIVSGSTNKKAVHLAWVHSDFSKCYGYLNNFRSAAHMQKAYESMDTVVCVSKQAEQGFCKVVSEKAKTQVIYNLLPVDEIRQKAEECPSVTIPQHNLNCVIVARILDEVKGQCRLVRAVAELHNEGFDIALTIVGDGPDWNKVEQLIQSENAASYIYMVGAQRNPYPYIKQADALVCASFYEGFNLTVAEAIICGTPIISTDCTGPREILDGGKYGLLVENSEEGIVGALHKLICQPNLYDKLKEGTKERLDFFDEKTVLAQIINLFGR